MRNTLVGLLVLAAIAGGVYWARRPSPALADDPAADAGLGHRVATAAAEAAWPDVTAADASVNAGDVRITLSVAPHPPVAFATNRFRVRSEAATGPLALEDATISFEMVMPMGDHRYALTSESDGWQEADVVLPMCASGNPRWYAIVEGTHAGQPRRARFKFDLAK